MPTIYFMRHGQTDWNADLRLHGQIDIPLNVTGRAQARRNGRALAELLANPAALDYVASPLIRARQTMEIVRGELGLTANGFRLDPALKEINYGLWQGHSWAELKAREPEAIAARFANPWATVAPGDGGESFAMLYDRACAWFHAVARDTVVVTHGGIKRCLRGAAEGLTPDAIMALDVPQDKLMVIRDGAVDLV